MGRLHRPYCRLLLIGSFLLLSVAGTARRCESQSTPKNSPKTSLPKNPIATAIDASLNDCCLTSLDRGWAVGDRGLILHSSDGGKSWVPQESGVEIVLYGIAMINDKVGCVVGGSIQESSLQSVGTILNTKDGGRTWTQNAHRDLPRLTGIQALNESHWMAWGDYSPHYRSSLFESIDGGITWSSSLVPLGHLQQCAWLDRNRGIAIDRLSRVFRIEAPNNAIPTRVGGDPTRPLLCAHFGGGYFWIAGTEGQLFRSPDGDKWEPILLPGLPTDHRWIAIHSIRSKGKDVWVAGYPGNVIWHSQNQGKDWKAEKTNQSLHLSSLGVFSSERLIAVGSMGRILGTRNGGQGWWIENNAGDRVGLLNIAASDRSAAWDALGMASAQAAKHSSLFLTHAHDWESKVDYVPDHDARLDHVRNRLALTSIRSESRFPIQEGDIARTQPSLYYPETPGPMTEVMQAMVLAIRTNRPDVIIADTQVAGFPLENANCKVAMEAIQVAADSSISLFSPESGIQLAAWKTPKVYARSMQAKSGLHIMPQQLLSRPGLILVDFLRPTAILAYPDEPQPLRENRYVLLKSPNFHDASLRDIFGGLANDPKTNRASVAKGSGSYQEIQNQVQRSNRFDLLLQSSGTHFQKDLGWEQELERFVVDEKNADLANLLFRGSQESLNAGYWNRWRVLVEKLIRLYPTEGVTAEAYRQLLFFSSSEELLHWTQSQLENEVETLLSVPNTAVAVASSTPSSPFQKDTSGENDVRLASFSEAKEVSRSSSNSKSATNARAEASSDRMGSERSNAIGVASLIPPKMIGWAQQQMTQHQPALNLDPRIRLARSFLTEGGLTPADGLVRDGRLAAFEEFSVSTPIAGWCQVGKQEKGWLNGQRMPDAMRAFPTMHVPQLDGFLDDPVWLQTEAPTKEGTSTSRWTLLSDPWRQSSLKSAQVQFAYNKSFLFIAIRAPRHATIDEGIRDRLSDLEPQAKKTRQRDEMRSDRDHVKIRFDLDRDYATWFGFGIDSEGELQDECCRWSQWNPTWYVASAKSPTEWTAEMAIPLSELTSRPIQAGECWGANLHRWIPEVGSQNNGRVTSDHFLPQGMRLLHFVGSP